MSWQKMPQFTDQSYSSAHFNSYVVNMMFPRKIIVNYYTQISHKFFTFQSHILILIIVEYHYFRVIGKFSLSRSKNDKICFFKYSKLGKQIIKNTPPPPEYKYNTFQLKHLPPTLKHFQWLESQKNATFLFVSLNPEHSIQANPF